MSRDSIGIVFSSKRYSSEIINRKKRTQSRNSATALAISGRYFSRNQEHGQINGNWSISTFNNNESTLSLGPHGTKYSERIKAFREFRKLMSLFRFVIHRNFQTLTVHILVSKVYIFLLFKYVILYR